MTSISDLPEPKRREFNAEEKRRRQWKLLVTFLTFVAGYATLHKLFIPFALSFTSLKGTPYAQIDAWFCLPVLLAWMLQRGEGNDSKISLLAGAAIVYGVFEVYEAAQGRYTGWLLFSRLLSAVPVSIGSAFLMSRRRLGGSLPAAWLGAVLLVGFLGFSEWQRSHPPPPEPAASDSNRNLPLGEFASCGAQALTIPADATASLESKIEILDCGFSPSVLLLASHHVEMVNRTSKAVNLRFFLSEGGKPHSKWNILVPAQAKAAHDFTVPAGAAGLVISDSAPALGLVAILPPDRSQTWSFSRKPISIGVRP